MTNEIKEMNNEELEIVSGGVIGDCNSDSKFLTEIGVMNGETGCMDLTFHWGSKSSMVDEAWKKVGVTCVSHPASKNVYYINGKKVSRNDAIKAVAKATGFSGELYMYFS